MHQLGMSRLLRARALGARALSFLRMHGSKRLAQKIAKRIQNRLISQPSSIPIAETDTGPLQGSSAAESKPSAPSVTAASSVIALTIPLTSALRFFCTPRQGHGRISLITDHSPSEPCPESFRQCFGLIATLAQHRQQRLRIISRQQALQAEHLLSCCAEPRIDLLHDFEMCYLPLGSFTTQVDLFPDELIFTSSWTSTASVMSTVDQQNIYYLLQEDEHSLCKNENDAAACMRIWSDQRVNLVITTPRFLMQLQSQGWCAHAQTAASVLAKLSQPSLGSSVF
jgi:hypothetical protein